MDVKLLSNLYRFGMTDVIGTKSCITGLFSMIFPMQIRILDSPPVLVYNAIKCGINLKENIKPEKKMKYIIGFLFLMLASIVNAQDCQNFKDSGDGIPAEYFRHECEGNKALKAKQYEKAAYEFKEALSVSIHEAPNYELNVELVEALCKLNKKAEAKKIIREFKCMAAVDLGELECYDKKGKPNTKLTKKCFDQMCIIGLGLTSEGKNNLLKKRAKMKQIEANCK
ncbi:MAG: tetratricopeptide repeat protein [Nitrospirae bacterium]|nr:tetratricopeptide repeat protein [Nitrospirota bacterium]